MKIKSIELGSDYRHGYGDGARPGMKCEVEVQTGDLSYQSVKLRLSDEALRRVVDLIVAETAASFVLDAGEVDLVGAPGIPRSPDEAEMPAARPVDVTPL